MTDWFALLDLPPRPQLPEADLKERYHRLAAQYHPDAAGGDAAAFTFLQQAYQGLLDPAARVRHLLELKFPGYKPEPGSMHLTDLFMQVGPILQQAKAASLRLDKATTTLARTLASLDVADTLRKLRAVRASAEESRQTLEARLNELDARWPAIDPVDLSRWASEWTFLAKWRAELNEWEFRLANASPVPQISRT